MLRGSGWTIAGHGVSVLIRLTSSLILTRLLFPEVYGVMSLVWMLMYGLAMFSDVGLGPAIIRDRRGDDPDFLNTAWTVQAIRGAVLWLCSCLAAGPMALLYGQPELAQLIPAAGLTALIAGFNSTALYTCRRHMDFKRLTLLELYAQIAGFAASALWALVHPTAWAIVGGTLISSLFSAFVSHIYLPGIRNGFRWETASLGVLIGFGKWIFLSSVFAFFSVQADRLLLGHYLDMAQLGIYSIAIMLSEAVQSVILKINYGVVLPAYGRVVQVEVHRLQSVVNRTRLGIDMLLVLPIGALMVLSSWIVDVLYDGRYQEAGWILQILCVRLLMTSALANSETCLVALGHPKYAFMQSACRGIWILVCIPAGWSLAGIKGVVWAVALSELPVMAVLWAGMVRKQMFSLRSEFRSLLFAGVGALLGMGLSQVLS